MNFMLDENVANSVFEVLTNQGHSCFLSREILAAGVADPLVAFVAENQQAILISHDGDFRKISPRIPDGQRTRFRKLSRVHLRCDEWKAAARLQSAMSLVEAEFELAQKRQDKRIQIEIGIGHIKTQR